MKLAHPRQLTKTDSLIGEAIINFSISEISICLRFSDRRQLVMKINCN